MAGARKGPPPSPIKMMRTPTPEGQKKRGRKPGCKKTGGSVKGSKHASTKLKETALEKAAEDVIGKLSRDQIKKLTPLEIMEMITRIAFEAQQLGLAYMSAQGVAPYRHAKLAPKIVKGENDDPDGDNEPGFAIRGGFQVD